MRTLALALLLTLCGGCVGMWGPDVPRPVVYTPPPVIVVEPAPVVVVPVYPVYRPYYYWRRW